jgi:hypothetical protein
MRRDTQFTVLVGRPIHVQQMDKPNLDQILAVQREYIDELMRYAYPRSTSASAYCPPRSIWHAYKDEFARTRLRELNIIE